MENSGKKKKRENEKKVTSETGRGRRRAGVGLSIERTYVTSIFHAITWWEKGF